MSLARLNAPAPILGIVRRLAQAASIRGTGFLPDRPLTRADTVTGHRVAPCAATRPAQGNRT